jgi:HSP20 family molecular chaperone IbpA
MNPNIITEPVTTLIEEERYLRIISNLPDINEEKIRIDLENNLSLVTITASNTTVMYQKRIIIPCDARILRKQFYDGVLEITLEKKPNILNVFSNTPSL